MINTLKYCRSYVHVCLCVLLVVSWSKRQKKQQQQILRNSIFPLAGVTVLLFLAE